MVVVVAVCLTQLTDFLLPFITYFLQTRQVVCVGELPHVLEVHDSVLQIALHFVVFFPVVFDNVRGRQSGI